MPNKNLPRGRELLRRRTKFLPPGGRCPEGADEELGSQQKDFAYAKTKQICPHSSSVTACAVPPSPREKVFRTEMTIAAYSTAAK